MKTSFPIDDLGKMKSITFEQGGFEGNVFQYKDFDLMFINDQLCFVCEIPVVHYRVVLPIARWRTIKKLHEKYLMSLKLLDI
jgi:hypothetical protein